MLSILHCNAASALSSARRLASSYEISSSSDGPGDSGRLAGAAADFETETEGDGTGAAEAVVAIDTCLRGATRESTEGAAGFATGALAILAAAALSLTSEKSAPLSISGNGKNSLTLQGSSVNGELDSIGRRSSSEVVDTSLESSLPSIEVHRCQLGERRVGQVNVERLTWLSVTASQVEGGNLL